MADRNEPTTANEAAEKLREVQFAIQNEQHRHADELHRLARELRAAQPRVHRRWRFAGPGGSDRGLGGSPGATPVTLRHAVTDPHVDSGLTCMEHVRYHCPEMSVSPCLRQHGRPRWPSPVHTVRWLPILAVEAGSDAAKYKRPGTDVRQTLSQS